MNTNEIKEINDWFKNWNAELKNYEKTDLELLCDFAAQFKSKQRQLPNEKNEIPKAIEILRKAFEDRADGSYYYGWQSNIAMAFYDEWNLRKESAENIGCELKPFDEVIYSIANQAAKNFINLLIE